MGKRNVITVAVLGAIAGGLISLISKDTRNYVSEQKSLGKDQMVYMVQDTTQSIRNIQSTNIETAESAASSLDGALNAVDQVESTINDIRKEDQQKLN